jgi:hypothetical protein
MEPPTYVERTSFSAQLEKEELVLQGNRRSDVGSWVCIHLLLGQKANLRSGQG